MGCCGNKRAALARENAGVAVTVTPPPSITPRAGESVLFKYVGPGKLALKGAVSGNDYVFTRTGVELAVAREDSVALMSHRYLRVRYQ